MSKGSVLAGVLALIGFSGFALQPVGQLGLALADEQEPDVASPAPDETVEGAAGEAAEEDSEGGEMEAEEGSENPD